MKRITTCIVLTGFIWSGLGIFSTPKLKSAIAQTQESADLFYLYKGERIPLNQRQDAIAVSFKDLPPTRNLGAATPLYLQLQQDLQRNNGRMTTPPIVTPLGENYAVVNVPREAGNAVQQSIQQQPYVQTTLPVLSRRNEQDVIILPNEIILSFDSKLSENQRKEILQQNNLEVVRKLRFQRDRYLVKSTIAEGAKVLSVANQLSTVQGINSVSPNFVQSVSQRNLETTVQQVQGMKKWEPNKTIPNTVPQVNSQTSPESNLLGLSWHLDSTPMQQCLQQDISDWDALESCLQTPNAATKSVIPRTDIRVKEAWKRSNGGRGVVVAVLDSLIQWNHPDLADSLYKVQASDKCPGEVHGWDFSGGGNSADPCKIGDAETRINPTELAILGSQFQDTFQLSDAKLVQQYPREFVNLRRTYPDESLETIANILRYTIRSSRVGGEFHGTYVSGTIAAKPKDGQGLIGVAPNAQILPVRVFGLNGSFIPATYIEALGYAADRGADIINLSLGAMLPSEEEEQAIADILKAYPKLVIVASAGNSNYDQVGYPAGYPGVVSVGATNIRGYRAAYSNYGLGLDVVAPGGDLDTPGFFGGIPATGGTWLSAFWQGIPNPTSRWSAVVDSRGKYWWVEGTSFSAPAVSGVVALMKGEDPKRVLNRDRLTDILKSTASYQGLNISDEDIKSYGSQSEKIQQHLFGRGLVNADAAVQAVKKNR
ncbi:MULTISPECIES: S8 family serine peptidase [unclassified Nodularia (in: cyanobacteria)]|uniref:S8 family peptidase n=1 Tax=unclassified Nodularia (in: cyanobacteria) TaxID=2656917 RepID=UPI00187DFC77|nr:MULTISPECIES: S8 family serine peptidase [unclassified Nodularia (in: cyanobacteria)]MBE9198875.1 S8 family serine peptidase [Nodularia sp. LEGE 06071]MCC2695417.1 S8 family serine peptidase [Nodularia sp. LEGE 04288]